MSLDDLTDEEYEKKLKSLLHQMIVIVEGMDRWIDKHVTQEVDWLPEKIEGEFGIAIRIVQEEEFEETWNEHQNAIQESLTNPSEWPYSLQMLSRYLRFFEKKRKRLIALKKMEASLEADRY
jgi:hypothetical protein